MDIFWRFDWIAPLTTKKSSHMKKELQRIYKEHGQPECLQSDNGGEFKCQVKDYCKSKKIEMINCCPYSPKAQGKIERSHRLSRQKIYHDLIQQKKIGVNWIKNLPDYVKCLNNEKKRKARVEISL